MERGQDSGTRDASPAVRPRGVLWAVAIVAAGSFFGAVRYSRAASVPNLVETALAGKAPEVAGKAPDLATEAACQDLTQVQVKDPANRSATVCEANPACEWVEASEPYFQIPYCVAKKGEKPALVGAKGQYYYRRQVVAREYLQTDVGPERSAARTREKKPAAASTPRLGREKETGRRVDAAAPESPPNARSSLIRAGFPRTRATTTCA